MCVYLPRLHTLPNVKRTANLRALSTSMGESAIAYTVMQGERRVCGYRELGGEGYVVRERGYVDIGGEGMW